MREILFRGKRVDNGEWIQGYPCRYGWIGKEKDYIIPDYASALYTVEIDPETVGQCTGFVDNNGKKIFEGDIVWDEWLLKRGVVEWDEDFAYFLVRFGDRILDASDYGCYDDYYYKNSGCENTLPVEIVGNAYDNPEMMEEIEEDYE